MVKDELRKLGLHFIFVDMGVVEVMENLTDNQKEKVRTALQKSGLDLMDDKKAVLVERIKIAIIEMVHYKGDPPKVNFSDYLSQKLGYDYTYMSNLFSELQGTTIEKFMISHKIELVKELIIYDELSLSEIAWKLHYSSVGHLSNQFKKVTGLTPSHFKLLKDKRRIAIEDIGKKTETES